MDLLLIVILTCLGALFGVAVGLCVPHANVGLLVLASSSCSAIGLIIAYVLLFVVKTRRRKHRQSTRQPALRKSNEPTSQPFHDRLFAFSSHFGVENKGADPFAKSKMPFWTRLSYYRKVTPKSAQAIRQLIWNIRRILRG